MRIGYSCWGFIGPGVIDTPDGGRFWRQTLLDTLQDAGHHLVLLQSNRDLHEAADDYTARYAFAEDSLPELDALILEWRWPLPGRNTTPCNEPGHTCDLHRQQDLVDHYVHRLGLPTILWDTDRELPADDPLRTHPGVRIADPARHTAPGAVTLFGPISDQVLDTTNPEQLASLPRPLPLVYVGNQYGRDREFDTYFAPAARRHDHRVAGKWTNTERWPWVNFTGRIGFSEGQNLYRAASATLLLLPPRYWQAGSVSQRIGETILAGCLPIAPAELVDADSFAPRELQAATSADAMELVTALHSAKPTTRARLLELCLPRLDQYRASHALEIITGLLTSASG
jgi:hypothetical protein